VAAAIIIVALAAAIVVVAVMAATIAWAVIVVAIAIVVVVAVIIALARLLDDALDGIDDVLGAVNEHLGFGRVVAPDLGQNLELEDAEHLGADLPTVAVEGLP
jgi:hypothetical protein